MISGGSGRAADGGGEGRSSAIELTTAQRVLVTGASGVIGRQVVELLRDRVQLVCVSRRPHEDGEGVAWVAADLGDYGCAAQLIRDVEPSDVIHLAGVVRGDRTLDAVLPTLRANLVGTVELLEACARANVSRLVVSGSLLEEPSSDDPTLIVPSPYGASRWSSSMYARLFHAHFGLPVTILRPSYAYGPGQEDKLIPHVVLSALRGEGAALALGDRLIDFVYAEDVARAYISALTAVDVEGRTIDIGYGTLTSVRDVVEAVRRVIGPDVPAASYGAIAARPFEQEIHVDIEPARRLLGWSATTSLEDGLRRTVEWYRAFAR